MIRPGGGHGTDHLRGLQLSDLLSRQRCADRLLDRGAVVHWRAVEHAPYLPLLGASDAAERDERLRELTEAAGLALPGEHLPSMVPSAATNTRASRPACAPRRTSPGR